MSHDIEARRLLERIANELRQLQIKADVEPDAFDVMIDLCTLEAALEGLSGQNAEIEIEINDSKQGGLF